MTKPSDDAFLARLESAAYEISVVEIQGDRYGQITDEDRYRAAAAGTSWLRGCAVTAASAFAAYARQWDEFDDEDLMHGVALEWIHARQAADAALTLGWAHPEAVHCSIVVRGG